LPETAHADDRIADGAIEKYLDRIGLAVPLDADVRTLALLQQAHLDAVPFENLSIHLDEPIVLTVDALVDKIVSRRRGGFCYELNGAFGALLAGLGFRVTLMAARVSDGKGGWGPPYDHLALRVDLDEPWLVDVGFGTFSRQPLRLMARDEQSDPAGRFLLVDADHGDIEVRMDGKPNYLLDPRPRALADFRATCWWHQTSPKSHFTQSLVCSLPTATGRITLNDRLLIRTDNGERSQTSLESDDEILAAYEQSFGLQLSTCPHLRADRPLPRSTP
jgi:N-hydroxyarylamine O-acetyltransferase